MRKLYYNRLMYMIIALIMLNFISCQEFNIDSQEAAPISINIDAQSSYVVLASDPSNIVFSVSSNTPWEISSDTQWCYVNPAMSGASSLVSEIIVEVESNNTNKERTATLTIKADNVDELRVITIKQVSKENLVVIPYDEIVATEGGKIHFNIVSNKPWEIIPSSQFIEDIDKTSGEGNESGEKETITINIGENSSARREGEITVKTAFEEYTFTITQDGVVIEQEEPSESGTIDFGYGKEEKIVKIRSNTNWKVKVPSEYSNWISAEALSNSELKVTLNPNNRLSTRSGKIILTTVDIFPGFEDVEFEVKQNPGFWFSGSADNFVISEDTGNLKVIGAGNNITSHYVYNKGHLKIEFDEINLTGDSRLVFNMWPNTGNTNFNFVLRSEVESSITCGGGFDWEQKTFAITSEELKSIKVIEFFVEDDPENVDKLRIRLVIDGVDMAILKGKENQYLLNPSSNPGQIIYFQLYDTDPGNYYVVKSVTHTPFEL